MNELLDDDDRPSPRADRELTLSTGAILSIFLGLVVLCGVCFGVGYNVGHKSSPTPLAINDTGATGDALSADTDAGSKPAPGAVADNTAPPTVVNTPAPAPKSTPVVRKPAPVVTTPARDEGETPESTTPPRTATATPAPVVRVPPSALMPSAAPAAGASTVMVQVAAVSHQEDADLLVGALRARGYTVSARPSAADNFIHVQVGPFADKKQAEVMRQRLISDGYNAIVK